MPFVNPDDDYMYSRTCEVTFNCLFTHYGKRKHLGNVIWMHIVLLQTYLTNPTMHLFHIPCTTLQQKCTHIYVHIGVRKWLFRNLTYNLWDLRYGSTVTAVSGPVFNLEYFGLIYSVKFKMTPKKKQGVKSDPEFNPLIFSAGPTKMPLQYYNWLCPLKNISMKHTYLHCWLRKDLLHIYLTFPCKT